MFNICQCDLPPPSLLVKGIFKLNPQILPFTAIFCWGQVFLLFCFVFSRLCSVFCFTHTILDACERGGIKYLFVSSCPLKLSVNMNRNLSLTITSLKWISVHFLWNSVCSKLVLRALSAHHDHHCSQWTFVGSPVQMSQGLSRAGGVSMSFLQCTLPHNPMSTSTLVIWKGCCRMCLHPRSCSAPQAAHIGECHQLAGGFCMEMRTSAVLSGSSSQGMGPIATHLRVPGQFCSEEEAGNKLLTLLSVAHYNYCIRGWVLGCSWEIAAPGASKCESTATLLTVCFIGVPLPSGKGV